MLGSITRLLLVVLTCAACALAQQTPKVSLDTSETLFSVLTAINNCGYDQELGSSAAVRQQVRSDVARAVHASRMAGEAQRALCAFYRDHQQPDPARDLAQYVSLALSMGDAPELGLKVKEADLPPDAAYVLGFVPLLKRFYADAGLHPIWERHRPQYEMLIDGFHEPVSKLLLSTDVYLKLPISGYLGRGFTILLEPMGAPGQVNSRNYGADYYVVVSPERGAIRLDQIRHTYLHYVLDPLALKRANSIKRLGPLLEYLKTAPLDESYKSDPALLVTESLIRAIEARVQNPAKAAEPARLQAVDRAVSEGFVLTRYFYEQLAEFEKSPVGLKDAYPDWLFFLDLDREKKRAAQVQFASNAAPEVVRASKPKSQLLDTAEQRMASGDVAEAAKLAQQALDEKQEDAGRALFILAQASVLNKDMQGARSYFERALGATQEPRLVAWAHIYLGRISDLQENRKAALEHYRAALAAGGSVPEIKSAAQRGLEKPYEPPVSSRREQ